MIGVMKVIALNGSPRPGGNTAHLLNCVLQELEAEGIATELVQVGGSNIRGCGACLKCMVRKDSRCSVEDDANGFMEKIFAADGVVLGSPTYFSNVTAEMKALIDRTGYVARANGGLLRRKVGAGVVAMRRAGGLHAFDTLNHFFLINEMMVPGSSYWNVSVAKDPGDAERDPEGIRTMQALGRNMAWLLKKLEAPG
jgi:multimeric flavodoxin WrbA